MHDLDIHSFPTRRSSDLVQGAGAAMRMKSARFSEEVRKSPQLQRQVSRYTRALMSQITQTAACNRFHVVEARLARWLLMTDRKSTRLNSSHRCISYAVFC